MNNQLKMVISILISFLFMISCEEKEIEFENLYSYKNDKNISDSLGRPANDSVYYFPIEYILKNQKSDSVDLLLGKDIFIRLSSILMNMDEPILTNSFLNKEIFRFLWFDSFYNPIMLRLEKNNNKIQLIEKKINFHELGLGTDNKLKTIEFERVINEEIWDSLKIMIMKNKMLQMKNYESPYGVDGSHWLLEIHNSNGYYFVERWSPDTNEHPAFRKICDYILDLSSFKDEERY